MDLPPIPEDSAAARASDENQRHYSWFLTYLALDPPRTTARVARETGRAEGTIRRIAGQNRWRQRAEHWEWERRRHQADQLRAAASEVAAGAIEGATVHLRNLTTAACRLDPERLPPREIAPGLKSMSEVGLDVGRYASELEERAEPPSEELRDLAEADPKAAATRALSDFVVNGQGRPSETNQAARALLSLPAAEETGDDRTGEWQQLLENLPGEYRQQLVDLLMRTPGATS